jgi:plasmid stabilization system protein ParE
VKLVLSPRAMADIDRLHAFLAKEDRAAAQRATTRLADSIQLLKEFPGLDRPIAQIGTRELFVPFAKASYVVRYHHSTRHDSVVILRVWHSRKLRR